MSAERHFYVYMLTNKFHNVLYTGMTNGLTRRVYEHREKQNDGFSKKYNSFKLVYYEVHYTAEEATKREKQLKKWRRVWKDNLIKEMNPKWDDLFLTLLHEMP